MSEGYLAQPLIFLVQVLFGLYARVVILLNPLRRLIPGVGGVDVASLVLAWLVITVEQLAILAILGQGLQPLAAMLLAIPELIALVINIFLFSILILVIISWINPGSYNPAIGILRSLTEPLLAPVRRRMPDMGGLDLSPLVVMLGLVILEMLLIPPIRQLIMPGA